MDTTDPMPHDSDEMSERGSDGESELVSSEFGL
jgi:hypothetical protein